MNELLIDVETYSDVDLSKSGVFKYVESNSFEILLFGYSVDGSDVKVVDLANGEKIPPYILDALTDSNVKKFAFNSMFERIALSKFLGLPCGTYLDPSSWYCDMVWCSSLGLPLSLENVGIVLGLEKKKLSVGKDLIRYFCKPVEPTKSNGGRTRNLPSDAPDKWELFKEYNARDVQAELEIHNRISKFPMQDFEWENYHLDQRINNYGILLDMEFVNHAISVDEKNSESNYEIAIEITGINNPNSPKQLKEWLVEQGESDIDSLSKAEIKRLLQGATGNVEEILLLRQEMAKTSIKKYISMQNAVCSDSRARGLIQFYGTHTGRFAGRLIQVQNLVANHLPNIQEARKLVIEENMKEIQVKYGSISNVLSELIRTSFIAKPGHRFIVADFSQIESRVISYMANETWRLEAYRDGKDIYCETATRLIGKPVTKTNENSEYRKYGKIAELACGYGGSIGALKNFGALTLGIKEEELPGIINGWRSANPHIVKMWSTFDSAVKYVIKTHNTFKCYGTEISLERGILFIKLPSGRRLAYCKPRIGINNFGSECVQYEGVGTGKRWEIISTFGGRIVENVVQAFAADVLMNSMRRLDQKGFKITITVHDEVVLEVPNGVSSVKEVCNLMSESPSWAKDLLLKADGYECLAYEKR